MVNIRSTRKNKYKKTNQSLFIIMKITSFFVSISVIGTNLNSYTVAYMNDVEEESVVIQSGHWQTSVEVWDKSSLTFSNKDTEQTVAFNQPVAISVKITNIGTDMLGTSEYEIYYIEKGNPKDGVKVAEGIINKLDQNQSTSLSYNAAKPGKYIFRAFQRSGHNNDFSKRQDLWSETISLVTEETQLSTLPKDHVEQNGNEAQQKETNIVESPDELVNSSQDMTINP